MAYGCAAFDRQTYNFRICVSKFPCVIRTVTNIKMWMESSISVFMVFNWCIHTVS